MAGKWFAFMTELVCLMPFKEITIELFWRFVFLPNKWAMQPTAAACKYYSLNIYPCLLYRFFWNVAPKIATHLASMHRNVNTLAINLLTKLI